MIDRFNYHISSKFYTPISWRLRDNKTIRRPILYLIGPLISYQICIIFLNFPNSNEAIVEDVSIVSWSKHSSTMRKSCAYPDSKVHGSNMGPIWDRQDPGGPHVCPMNFAIRVLLWTFCIWYRMHTATHAALKTLHTFRNELKFVALFDKQYL